MSLSRGGISPGVDTMGRCIAVIQGHLDQSADRFGRALAAAYMRGAREGGHEVMDIDVAGLDFPLLHSKEEFEHALPPGAYAAPSRPSSGPGTWCLSIPCGSGPCRHLFTDGIIAHSLKSLERNILRFCGISPIMETLIGTVESIQPAEREKWLSRLHGWGGMDVSRRCLVWHT